MDNPNFAGNPSTSNSAEHPVVPRPAPGDDAAVTDAPAPEHQGELRFGYTLADLQRMASYAASDCRWAASLPWGERIDVALSALAEHLYRAAEAPTSAELRNTAWNALSQQVRAELRHHGFDRDTGAVRPGFVRYWSSAVTVPSPEEAVVERLARAQIWAVLPKTLREALHALADAEDEEDGADDADGYGRAAEILKVSRAVATTRVSRARAAFYARWHEHEQPSRLYSRHRPRRTDSEGKRRAATRSIIERDRYLKTKTASGDGHRPMYARARRVELSVPDTELARRYYHDGATLGDLAQEYGTSRYTIRNRINQAQKDTARKR